MSKQKRKFKHLEVQERITIAAYLNRGLTVSEIAMELKVSKSTVSREISRHGKSFHGADVPCEHRDRRGICNGCKKPGFCTKNRFFYDWQSADDEAERDLRSTRAGSRLGGDDIDYVDRTMTPLIRNGQSINHAYAGDERVGSICSQSTVRRMIYRGELTVKAHELKNYVKFAKPKKEYFRKVSLRNPEVLVGRTFADFTEYVRLHPDAVVTEYDSVIGRVDDKKAILTVTFVKYRLQLGFLVNKGESGPVISAVRKAFRKAGGLKGRLFEAMLADNGTKFSSFHSLEDGNDGVRTFFTRPYKASDKPHCERNHVIVRELFPKGKSLDGITQETLDEAFSNINSYARPSMGNLTPYEAFEKDFGAGFLTAMNIMKIESKKVRLRPLI